MAGKQVSEMSEEELASYKEEGAQEGDWMDYLPTGFLKAGSKGAGKLAARKISQGMLDRIKAGAKEKMAREGKTGTGVADTIQYPKTQGGVMQDNIAMGTTGPIVTQRPKPAASPAPTAGGTFIPAGSKAVGGSALSGMQMPHAGAAPAAAAPASRGRIVRKKPVEPTEDESALPPTPVSGGY